MECSKCDVNVVILLSTIVCWDRGWQTGEKTKTNMHDGGLFRSVRLSRGYLN